MFVVRIIILFLFDPIFFSFTLICLDVLGLEKISVLGLKKALILWNCCFDLVEGLQFCEKLNSIIGIPFQFLFTHFSCYWMYGSVFYVWDFISEWKLLNLSWYPPKNVKFWLIFFDKIQFFQLVEGLYILQDYTPSVLNYKIIIGFLKSTQDIFKFKFEMELFDLN